MDHTDKCTNYRRHEGPGITRDCICRPIAPRTEEESEAYIAGYAQAILDVQRHGFAQAVHFLDVIGGPSQ